MTTDALDRAIAISSSALTAEIKDTLAKQERNVDRLHRLDEGEVVRFYPLTGETPKDARDRLLPRIRDCESRHKIKLLAKVSGRFVRVRRLPDRGNSGPLAEWHNLLPGQSDVIHEWMDEEEAKAALLDARKTAERLAKQKKGNFWVHVTDYVIWEVRVTRMSNSGRPPDTIAVLYRPDEPTS